MFEKIIWFSIKNKLLVGLFTLFLIGFGIYSTTKIPIDAVPDITNNQVQVVTVSPSLAPQEVEQFITYPVEIAMANVPGAIEIRSISRFGLSVVTIVFEEDIPNLDARQYVKEQISIAAGNIPSTFGTPELMPITTGLGEIYQYVLEVEPGYEDQYDAMELRTIQDWIVKRQLSGIEGIVEVSSFGGYLKQYEVAVDPFLLETHNLSISDVFTVLEKNNQNTGGSYIEKGTNAFYIRSEGLVNSLDDIRMIPVKETGNTPLLIEDIATVKYGSAPRFGAMTMDGKGEAVGGITLMLKGANSSEAIDNVITRVEQVQKSLPEGIHIYPYLDRSELVGKTIKTVITNLVEGGLIVILVLILLLGHWRSGLIVASVIPLAMLFALIMMNLFGVSANLMSLGAIDFGIVVDGAVIIIESILHTIFVAYGGQRLTQQTMDEVVYASTKKLYRSAAFGVLIILVVFIPILTLQGIEGKMFTPMAKTVSFAILGALILSVTYVPMMAALVIKKNVVVKRTIADRIMDLLRSFYKPTLLFALNHPKKVVATSFVALVMAIFGFVRLGGEFIPTLEEGDLAMQMTIQPGSSLSESIKAATKAETILMKEFPEVNHVISKIGTAEVPTDPMAIEDGDVMIILKEKDEWVSAETREELVAKMKEKLSTVLGATFEFTQPIQLRFNELMTGSKADIAIKIFGEDMDVLATEARKAEQLIKPIPGAGDVKVEQTEGFPQLVVKPNRKKLALYQLSVEEVNAIIRSAYAGETAGTVFEGERRFDLVVRLNDQNRDNLDLSKLYINTPKGKTVPLSEIATVQYVEGPMQISREDTKRRITIGVNVRNRDVASLVGDIQNTLNNQLELPPGYSITYGGEFENLQNAQKRLGLAVPVALLLILVLLFMAFGSVKKSLLIFSAVPLSAIGGVIALYLRGMPFSISAGIGFIALFGVAVLNGIVLLSYISELQEKGKLPLKELLVEAGLSRLRPVIMTAAVASLGFLPMALSSTAGAEVQKPLATVVIGGLITATLLTLVVFPAIYLLAFKTKNKIHPPQLASVVIMVGFFFMHNPSNAQELTYPEEMQQFLEKVTTNNQQVQMANYNLQVAEAQKLNSWQLSPLNVQYQYGQIDGPDQDYNLQIIQNFGSIPSHIKRGQVAKSRINFQEEQLALQKGSAETHAAMMYIKAWKLSSELKKLEQVLSSFNSFLELNALRFETGEISALEKLNGETLLAGIQQQKGEVEVKLMETLAHLQNLQVENATIPIPSQSIETFNYVWNESEQNLNPLLTSPYVADIEVKQQQVGQLKASYFPALSLGYFNQQLQGVTGFQGVIFGASFPLWYKPQKSMVLQSKIERERAQTQLAIQEVKGKAKLQQVANQLNTYATLLDEYKTYLSQAKALREQSTLAYENGEISLFQHLYNEREALTIELKQFNLIETYNQLTIQHNFLKN